MDSDKLILGAVQYVALLLALCVHEFSHAALAYWLGDRTAEEQGRLTLNPIAHIDPVGTVLLPLLGLFTAFPMFGWARPVPVQPAHFRQGWYAKGQVLVAAGGPGSNVVQALFWVLVYGALTHLLSPSSVIGTPLEIFRYFVFYSVLINLILAAFNLIPVPPLDGAHVASWSLPRRLGEKFDAIMEPYGFILLVLLLVSGVLRFVLQPAVKLGDTLIGWVGAW